MPIAYVQPQTREVNDADRVLRLPLALVAGRFHAPTPEKPCLLC